jgi:ATP-dependent RNA helicase DDX24/MAK5
LKVRFIDLELKSHGTHMMTSEQSQNKKESKKGWKQIVDYPPILQALQDLGFDQPTEIQRKVIPIAIEQHKDILGAAPTGSGKTLAFGIPLVRYIDRIKKVKKEPKLRALILAPTRELVVQIKRHLDDISKHTSVTSVVVIGGMAVQKQERVLNHKPDIVIATPGRLWELIEDEEIEHISHASLQSLKYLIVDEYDKMIEKNHFEEMTKIVQILTKAKKTHQKRRILVFSATLTYVFRTPERWKYDKKKANKVISVKNRIKQMKDLLGMKGDTEVVDLTERGIGKPNNKQLKEFYITCMQNDKDLYLYYILATCRGRTIIFCNSKDCVRRLISILKQLQLDCIPLHAELDQKVRLKNLDKFRNREDKILVASDVAARGLDIDNVERVIHYQVPRTLENYVHRSGRTARGMCTGVSIMLYEPSESKCFRNLMSAIEKTAEINEYPIDRRIFDFARARAKVAQDLNAMEHRVHKRRNEKGWFERMADECDIDLKGREDIYKNKEENSDENQKVKQLNSQLNKMLKTPLVKYVNLHKYLDSLNSQNVTMK